MRLKVSNTVKHNPREPFQFAADFAARRLRELGYPWLNVTVNCKWTRLKGRGYSGNALMTRRRGHGRITIRLGDELPPHEHRYARFKDMPSFTIWNKIESMVYIAAHEFGHIMGWPGGKDGEISCCKFGYAAVQAYRERQYESPACII